MFPSHVTLLGGFGAGLNEDEVRLRCRCLAQTLSLPDGPFSQGAKCSIKGVESGDIFWQCVFLRLHDDSALHAAHMMARTAFSAEKPPFMPHLSLLYSDMPQTERTAVVAELSPELLRGCAEQSFTALSLSLWLTPTGDASLTSWRELEEIPLGVVGTKS